MPPRPPTRAIPNAPAPRVPGRTGPPGLTREAVVAEADRLRAQAAKRTEDAKTTAEQARTAAEQARAAAARADRAAGIAKLAEEAAGLGREALDLAGKGGLSEAARCLDRARSLETSITAIESSRPPPAPKAGPRRDG